MSRRRTAILISGRGSNMTALLDAMADPAYPAEPALVLANRPEAAGLAAAAARAVPTRAVDHKAFPAREAFERALDAALTQAEADLVCLAGFMRVLTPWLIARWQGRLINIHPSLLPAFPGLDTHARALAARVAVHGCTVHFVTQGVDEGPIIGQAALAIRDGEDADALASRVLALEHRLYPLCLAAVARGGIRWADAHAAGPRIGIAELD